MMEKIIFNSSQNDIKKMTELMEKARETVREKEKVKKDKEVMKDALKECTVSWGV